MTSARSNDPETSHEAAASVRGLSDKREACLLAVKTVGPCTDEDLWSFYASCHQQKGWPMQSPSGLRTRRGELVRLGRVADSGLRSLTASGRRAVIWQALPG